MNAAVDISMGSIVMMALQFLMGILVAIICFIMKGIITDLKQVTRDLNIFQLSILKDAVMSNTFETYRVETRTRLHELGDTVSALKGAVDIISRAIKIES